MKTWTIYTTATGALLPWTITATDVARVAANLAPGQAAVEGSWDSQAWRVDLATKQVVPKSQSSGIEVRRARELARVQMRIQAAEDTQDRACREIVLALGKGQLVQPAAVQRASAVDATIAALRAVRAAIVAATTDAQLDAIQWPA